MFGEVSEGGETYVRGHVAGSQGRLQNDKATRTVGYRVDSEKGNKSKFLHSCTYCETTIILSTSEAHHYLEKRGMTQWSSGGRERVSEGAFVTRIPV